MNYIVFDIEATCDEANDFPMETLEIGAVKLDKKFNFIDEFTILIKPSKSYVTNYCTNLTGIKHEDVLDAQTFDVAIMEFIEFLGDEFEIYSWGAYDNKQLFEDCKRYNINSDFLEFCHDMKELYQSVTGVRAKGLKKAMNYMKVNFEGDRHRALPDAIATAKIFQKLKRMQE